MVCQWSFHQPGSGTCKGMRKVFRSKLPWRFELLIFRIPLQVRKESWKEYMYKWKAIVADATHTINGWDVLKSTLIEIIHLISTSFEVSQHKLSEVSGSHPSWYLSFVDVLHPSFFFCIPDFFCFCFSETCFFMCQYWQCLTMGKKTILNIFFRYFDIRVFVDILSCRYTQLFSFDSYAHFHLHQYTNQMLEA